MREEAIILTSPITGQGYDFIVTDTGFIVERQPDRNWRINELKHADYCVLAYALSGACNVTEAADQTGFGGIFYFSRLFKK